MTPVMLLVWFSLDIGAQTKPDSENEVQSNGYPWISRSYTKNRKVNRTIRSAVLTTKLRLKLLGVLVESSFAFH